MDETADILKSFGFEPLACPLFKVVFRDNIQVVPQDYQLILLTSRNGVRGLAASTSCRDIPLSVVGDHTAAFASEMGFLKVCRAGETVSDLLEWVRQHVRKESGTLLYGRGTVIRSDLKKILEKEGFHIAEKIFYSLQGIPNLPSRMVELLIQRKVWGAVFFSQFAAHHFKSLIWQAGLVSALKSLYLFGLSPTIMVPLEGLGRALITPQKPRLDSLLHRMTLQIHDADVSS